MLKKYKAIGMLTAILLAAVPLSVHAESVSSSYTLSAGAADVRIINTGADAIYDISLQPMGPSVDPAAAPIYVGTLAAGASTNIQINMAADMGYMVLNATGSDINGQPIRFSIVSQGR